MILFTYPSLLILNTMLFFTFPKLLLLQTNLQFSKYLDMIVFIQVLIKHVFFLNIVYHFNSASLPKDTL